MAQAPWTGAALGERRHAGGRQGVQAIEGP